MQTAHGEADINANPKAAYLKELSELNKLSCDILEAAGYDGKLLHIELAARSNELRQAQITMPNTLDWQNVYGHSKSQGQFFLKTGGATLNNNDYFIAMERLWLDEKLKDMCNDKRDREAALKRQDVAFKILEAEKSKFNSSDLRDLISWKTGKPCPSKVSSAADRMALWSTLKDKGAPKVASWTEGEEAELKDLEAKSATLTVEDTDVARRRELEMHSAASLLRSMTVDDRKQFREDLGATGPVEDV
jgi:hypothetical protein